MSQPPCLKCQIITERVPAELRERTGTSDEYRRVIFYCPVHAAAPQMLEALRDLLPYVESCADDVPAQKDARRIKTILRDARRGL